MDMKIPKLSNLNIKINHRNWRKALAEAFSILSLASPGEVVCITGPSRVGKTRLSQELAKLLGGGGCYEETGLMPVVVVSAANTGANGTFSTKSFVQRLLKAVDHPISSLTGKLENDLFVYKKMDSSTESTLRLAVENGLEARKTRFLFIDEVQHVRYTTQGAQAPYAVMDSWKCLAESAKVVLVVVGAYPILDIIQYSPHLIGRKHQVHFPRYSFKKDDLAEFVTIIKSYEEVLNLDKSLASLWKCYELLYEGTFGCIGLLRAWLVRASAFASVDDQGITRDLLLRTMPSESDREVIANEILEGEKLLSNNTADLCSKKKRNSTKPSDESKSGKKKSNVKPFQRKPKRMKPGNRTIGKDNDET